jgi:hypothetical protein
MQVENRSKWIGSRCDQKVEPTRPPATSMQSDLIADVAAAIAAVAAAVAVWYARDAARAGRATVVAARRTLQLAEASRRSTERAQLRRRVERVGELVEEIASSPMIDSELEELSPRSRGQCQELSQAVIGLKELLPRSAQVCGATSSEELQSRAGKARVEIDAVLMRMARRRVPDRHRATRPRIVRPRSNWSTTRR